MKSLLTTILALSALGVGAPTVYAQSGATQADSAHQARRSRRQRATRRQRTNPAVEEALGELSWGMSSDEVLGHFRDQIEARYLEDIQNAHDAIEEDDLRAKRDRAIRRLAGNMVTFDGEPTGWERSFLKNEFFHNGGLSMLTVRDSNSQNFYFFKEDELWKWYKAFDPEVFDGRTPEEVSRALQGRFGTVRNRQQDAPAWLVWRAGETQLRAMDERRFYGIYSLVFENEPVAQQVAEARPTREDRSETHPLVDAVTGYDGEPSFANSDAVDHITGRNRRAEAPETSSTRSQRRSQVADEPGRLERRDRGSVPTIRDRDGDDGAK